MATTQLPASRVIAFDVIDESWLDSVDRSDVEFNTLWARLMQPAQSVVPEFAIPIFLGQTVETTAIGQSSDTKSGGLDVFLQPLEAVFGRPGSQSKENRTSDSGLETDLLQSLESLLGNDLLLEFHQSELGNLAASTTTSQDYWLHNPVEYGTPWTDAQYWRYQQSATSCAVVAQICVFQSLTGHYISEADANHFAQHMGWFDPTVGTPIVYIGHILDVLGIPTYETFHALQSALARGDKPIVGLDANEIWYPQVDGYGNPLEQLDAGHAVWVIGINYGWDGSISILLNDSGTPYGLASVVSYGDFMNAWQDSGYFVSIADNPWV